MILKLEEILGLVHPNSSFFIVKLRFIEEEGLEFVLSCSPILLQLHLLIKSVTLVKFMFLDLALAI